MIDVDSNSLTTVKKILEKHLPGVEVKAFGSRVTGRAKKFSDLDLVIMSKAKLPMEKMNSLKFDFSNSDLPILIDVVDWSDISEEFQQAIQENWVTLER